MFNSNHSKDAHGFGGIWGSNNSSYHHNLIAHHSSRNPRFASGCGNTDYRNNVLYDWGYRSCYGAEAVQKGSDKFTFSNVNMVANYYKPGPATDPERKAELAEPPSRGTDDKGHWYLAENFVEGSPSVTADNWSGVCGSNFIKLNQPWDAIPINQQTAEEAFTSVLGNAGATLPRRVQWIRESSEKLGAAQPRTKVSTKPKNEWPTNQRSLALTRDGLRHRQQFRDLESDVGSSNRGAQSKSGGATTYVRLGRTTKPRARLV